jgi:RluA family pseudouridine synthase
MEAIQPNKIYADESILVINKPAGVLSIPDGYDPEIPHLRQILEPTYGRLWMVHRLDKETSGVIVIARSTNAHASLNHQFSSHQVSKTYHAIIQGNPDWDEIESEVPLRVNVGRRHRTIADYSHGKPALTSFEVLEHYSGISLLQAQPITGRTHQIRAHLYGLGFTILSDPLYGSGEISHIINRLALHAHTLSFKHPKTGQASSHKAPYPQDFQIAFSRLK